MASSHDELINDVQCDRARVKDAREMRFLAVYIRVATSRRKQRTGERKRKNKTETAWNSLRGPNWGKNEDERARARSTADGSFTLDGGRGG